MKLKKIIIFLFLLLFIYFVYNYINFCLELAHNNKLKSINLTSYTRALYLDNYDANILIEYISNNTSNKYEIIHSKKNNVEKLTYVTPEKFKDMTIEITKDGINHLNPYIQKNITYHGGTSKNFNNLLLTSFSRNFLNSKNIDVNLDNDSYIVLSTTIPGENYYFYSQDLYIDATTKLPIKMLVKSKDNITCCTIDYKKMNLYN